MRSLKEKKKIVKDEILTYKNSLCDTRKKLAKQMRKRSQRGRRKAEENAS